VTLKQAHKGTLKIDTLLLNSYGKVEEQTEQFYLESRKVLTVENNEQKLNEIAKKHHLKLVAGPMLGNLTSSGITFWFRTS
jgi:alkaline phosphatase D